jgi:O-antigen ligase
MMTFAICAAGYLLTWEWMWLVIPFALAIFTWGVQDFRRIYLLMWASIPFAIEMDLPGGLSTDFPAEPLMWLACLLLPIYVYLHHRKIDFRFLYHPLILLLVFHFFWIIFTSIVSQEPLISAKYSLAKSWYLISFVLIPLLLFRKMDDFKVWGLVILIPLIASVVIILMRHSQYGFTFSTINNAVIPIYRNHVDYACCLGIVLPFVWMMRGWFTGLGGKLLWFLSIGLILTGIYFSYTRAAWLCIPIAIGSWLFIRYRLMRIAIPAALALGILLVGWLAYDNTYLRYAPDYEKAITHQQFDDLVSATARMEDISTVERFYRWVAGFYMVKENPLTGTGPASFYSLYHGYVDRHFTTYVSDNPEQSGLHNYYLMIAVEQGLPGLMIFLGLVTFVLIYGERLHAVMEKGEKRLFLMAALMSFSCNLFVLTLNDMVETDKLGSFFFLCIAIVILFGMQEKLKEEEIQGMS